MVIQNQDATEHLRFKKAGQCLSPSAGGNAKCFFVAVRKKAATFQKILFKSPGVKLYRFCVTDYVWLFIKIALTFLKVTMPPNHTAFHKKL